MIDADYPYMRLRLFLFLLAVCAPATSALAQAPTTAMTPAQLRARVAMLERDIVRLQADYALLLNTCRAPERPARAAEQLKQDALQSARIEAENRAAQLRQDERLENDLWYVTSIDFGVTEVNKVFVRYGWKAVIHNGTDRPQTFDLAVRFLDDRDLVVDTDREYSRRVEAYADDTIYGEALIRVPGGFSVKKASAEATRKSR